MADRKRMKISVKRGGAQGPRGTHVVVLHFRKHGAVNVPVVVHRRVRELRLQGSDCTNCAVVAVTNILSAQLKASVSGEWFKRLHELVDFDPQHGVHYDDLPFRHTLMGADAILHHVRTSIRDYPLAVLTVVQRHPVVERHFASIVGASKPNHVEVLNGYNRATDTYENRTVHVDELPAYLGLHEREVDADGHTVAPIGKCDMFQMVPLPRERSSRAGRL